MNVYKLRKIIGFILPRGALSLIFFILACLLCLRNIFKSKLNKPTFSPSGRDVAYLFATGPSVNAVNFEKIIGSDVYTVSNFVLHESLSQLDPVMHFVAAFHAPLDMLSIDKWLALMDKKLPSRTVIVTDSRNKKFIHNRHFLCRKIVYLNTFPMLDLLIIKPPFVVPRPWSVPQLAIPYIFTLGYKEIVLCGCDHTALADYGKEINHFYKNSEDVRLGASDKLSWKDGGIIKQLESNVELFSLYRCMQLFYRKRGKEIFRLTNEGWLDFIPYKNNGEHN